MVERRKLIQVLGGEGQIPQYSVPQGGMGLKELLSDIKSANNQPSTQQFNPVAPTTFDPNSFYSHGSEAISGSRSGEKSSKPFLNRFLGGF